MIIGDISKRIGLGAKVAEIQYDINKAFDVLWSDKDADGNPTTGGILCYPLCEVNFKRNNKKIIYNKKIIEYFDEATEADTEAFKKRNVDYDDILDGEYNRMIVIQDEEIEQINNANFYKTKLEVIFVVNLNTTHPSAGHRTNEEVRSEVLKILEKIPNVTVYKTVIRLNKVFGDIQYSTALDMHPLHTFKVVLTVDRFSKTDKFKVCESKVFN